jgi:hypothetical protein
MAGLTVGKEPFHEGWTYVSCKGRPALGRCVESRRGEMLLRDPVGFPFTVMLSGAGRIGQPAALRLMKALALGVQTAASTRAARKRPRIERILIEVADRADAGHGAVTTSSRRGKRGLVLSVRLGRAWLAEQNVSLERVRAAAASMAAGLLDLRPSKGGISTKQPGHPGSRTPAKVLFFRNMFQKDVERGEALQINPGIHYLISPLIRKGVGLLLLEGKLPIQDVCEKPPDTLAPLPPSGFLTDPAEMEEALANHPDLSLVCLTVLERSFGQIRSLCRFIRERSRAFIAVGGVFPTLTPEHAFVHLPDVNFLVRGDGEDILPVIVEAVAGKTVDDGLDGRPAEALGRLEGLAARWGDTVMTSGLDRVNRVADLDRSPLDFSFLDRRHAESGLSLSTSRGCIYNCHFCSVMDKKVWRAKSAPSVLGHLRDYGRRLESIFGSRSAVPAEAKRIQIWDDDFFVDPGRAAAVLAGISRAGFTVTFIQGTVNSFFHRKGLKVSDRLNVKLLDAIPRDVFTRFGGFKLGTENFCDEELRRIGKPYRYERILKLALALGERKIDQEHYLILCNRRTTLENLLDNFEKIAELRWRVGGGFKVLEPSWLMNLFPTVLYKACRVKGMDAAQPTSGLAGIKGYGEFDYPFVISERPGRREVFEILRRFPRGMHFGAAGNVPDMFVGVFDVDDADYLMVFDRTRRVLLERRRLLESAPDAEAGAELARIDRCLGVHFAAHHPVPTGLLKRIAPGLAGSLPPPDDGPILLAYVAGIFRDAARKGLSNMRVSVEKTDQGVALDASDGRETVQFLVQRRAPGLPCAFASKNLVFVIRGAVPRGGPAGSAVRLIEKVRDLAERIDIHDLL